MKIIYFLRFDFHFKKFLLKINSIVKRKANSIIQQEKRENYEYLLVSKMEFIVQISQ